MPARGQSRDRRSHQARRRPRRRHRGGGAPAQARRRRARPDRARARRDHRHRHLRRHRRGDRRRRPVDRPLVRARRRHVRVLGALLRRAGVDDPGRRQRLHVLLRDDGRARRLDHRLGPDPRVRRVGRGRRRRLGRVPQRAARLAVRLHAARLARRPAGRGRHGQPAGGLPRARGRGAADARHPRERPRQHDHGVHQGRDPGALHRARRDRVHGDNFTPFAPKGTAAGPSSPRRR